MLPLMQRFGALLFLLSALAGPAPAQEAIPDNLPQEADIQLWCASALHFLGIATEDEAEAGNYFAASQILVQEAAETLMAADIPAADVAGLVEIYDERVVADFENGADLPYEPGACIGALGLE